MGILHYGLVMGKKADTENVSTLCIDLLGIHPGFKGIVCPPA